MRNLFICLAGLLVLSGCMTPDRVQSMIEDNNQKLAAEQLQPEFARIDTKMAEVSGQLEALSEEVAALKADVTESGQLTASRVQSLSLALNKAQGDMGLLQEKIKEVQSLFSMQQEDIRKTRGMVEDQKDALLTVFRKQQADLSSLIAILSGAENGSAGAPGVTAPAPVE